MKNGSRFWNTSQNGRNHLACMWSIRMKMKNIMTVSMRARGKRTRYAPSTPETAPEAPTAGMGLLMSPAMCASPASTPHPRYMPRYLSRPNFSSMLSPNIHRKSMLPPRCSMPPCRNVEEISVISGLAGHSTTSGPRPKSIRKASSPITQRGTVPQS